MEQEMYYVTFENGGMTKIHTHESEQILIATTTSPDSDASYLGEGFVTLIQKKSVQKEMIQNMLSRHFFLIILEIQFVFRQTYYIAMDQEAKNRIFHILQLGDQL